MSSPGIGHENRDHAILSASGSNRWMECPPSVRFEDNFRSESDESPYAKEGTLAHEFGQLFLENAKEKDFRELRKSKYYTSEMEGQVLKYVDYVREVFAESLFFDPDSFLNVEERVDFSDYVPEGFGTSDATIVGNKKITVVDLKYGKGIKVNAESNPQLLLYGLGALALSSLLIEIEIIEVVVVQPRLDWISTYDISVKDLLTWAEKEVKPKANLAIEGRGEFKSGDHCRFCKAKGACRKIAGDNLEKARKDFDTISDNPLEVNLLTDSEILEIYEAAKSIDSWLSSLKKHVLDSAKKGKSWEGYKLVEGRSNRKWTNEEEVIKKIRTEYPIASDEDILNIKLKGIGAIEDYLGKKEFENILSALVYIPTGAATLVPNSDKRQSIGIASAKEDFS